MKFPNLAWAIRERGSQFQFAAQLGESESWLSRRLTGRVEFTDEEQERVALTLGFPADWLFQTPQPPAVNLASRSGSVAEPATTVRPSPRTLRTWQLQMSRESPSRRGAPLDEFS